MILTRHETQDGPRWAADGRWLKKAFDLRSMLEKPRAEIGPLIESNSTPDPARGILLPPIDPTHEVWACGVTYQRSREARQAESNTGDVYDRVYTAQRPELFFKSTGWRVVGHGQSVRCRPDSAWNVPEPELVLVINRTGEIVGYTAGNDMSSRSIEGENPLYLPQAKIYNASCSLGPAIQIADASSLVDLPVELSIERQGQVVFHGETRTARLNRKLEELVGWLYRDLSFPQGAFLLTGTGIVPPNQFTLAQGDQVVVKVGDQTLVNTIGT